MRTTPRRPANTTAPRTTAARTFRASRADMSALVSRLRAAGCVFAEDEANLLAEAAHDPAELDGMVARRVAGIPLEQVVGWAEFCGLRVAVRPGVFVPRRRTEFLARQARRLARRVPGRPVVVDLCCGSGALGAAVAASVDVSLHAADIDPAAVACARGNLGAVPVYRGDLYRALPTALHGRIDILLANVPYVPTDAINLLPPEAREYEPHGTLDGGADGLSVARRVIADAPSWLAPGGRVLIEVSDGQVASVERLLGVAGLAACILRCPDLDATAAVGTRPTAD